MVNGLYTASRSMMNIMNKQDVNAQNLANANTTGFKITELATRSVVTIDKNDEQKLHQAEKQNLDEVYTHFTQGPLVQTGNHLDLAITGSGFFHVETPEGIGYSRNGSLSLNAEGDLVTLTGKKVLDDNDNPIHIEGQNAQFQSDGGVFVDGIKIAKLALSEFPNPKKLLASGDGIFRNMQAKENIPDPATHSEIKQGFLEGSNVDVVSTMVKMISQSKNYEANQRVIHAIDETLTKAVNDVGRI